MIIRCMRGNVSWEFPSLKQAKNQGILKDSIRLKDADEILTINGVKIAVYK